MAQEQAKKKNILRITLYSIFGVVLSFFLVMEVCLLSQKYIMKSKAPNFLGYGSAIVATGSMSGTINKGDMVIFKKTDVYKLGDIVTFDDPFVSYPVTHRIVNYGSEKGTFVTKGDWNTSTDSRTITKEQIYGKVVKVIPSVGWFTSDPEVGENGWVYFAAVIVIAAGMIYLLKIKPDDKKKIEDKNDKEEHLV
ncbi:MAG: signal peptidase I [Erysipelotrichales bacterium]|nr:signal peptidase I [Erysipelotrichales bacterium]